MALTANRTRLVFAPGLGRRPFKGSACDPKRGNVLDVRGHAMGMRTLKTTCVALCMAAATLNTADGQTADKPPSKSAIVAPVSGFTYFNRPGATLDQQRADLATCRMSVLAMAQPSRDNYASSTAGVYGLTGVLVGGLMDLGAQHAARLRAMPANYEDCMVVHGWRVVQLDDAIGRELDRLSSAQLSQRLGPMVGESAPSGGVVRAFANELGDQETELFTTVPVQRATSLSLKLLPDSAPVGDHDQRQAGARAASDAFVGREGRPVDATKPPDLGALPADATLIVVRVVGNGFESAPILVRADAAPSSGGDAIVATLQSPPQRGVEPQDQTYVYVAPPGHWRLTGFANEIAQPISFCLGAPAFEVGAGEAVFAGSFGFGGVGARLSLSLDPARTALASAPGLAGRLRLAVYTNGETFPCGGGASYLYAFEVGDAPFHADYALGSHVPSIPQSLSTAAH